MYYRRMEPQPGFLGVDAYIIPDDMPGAEPWHDRDGTWYWRRSLQ